MPTCRRMTGISSGFEAEALVKVMRKICCAGIAGRPLRHKNNKKTLFGMTLFSTLLLELIVFKRLPARRFTWTKALPVPDAP